MSSMTETATREALLRAFLDRVWSAGEVEACATYLAPAYSIHHDPGDPWAGQTLDLTAFMERVRLSRAPFPDQKFEIVHLAHSAQNLFISWTWTATHLGPVAHFPPTGRRLSMSGATIYYFDDNNRICGHWQVTDRLGIFQQLQQP